jgi:hypothetical protein
LIFLVIAVVASVAITVWGFKAQDAMMQLHKSFPDISESFIRAQRNRTAFLVLMGVALCGVVIITNIPSFAVKYSIWHGSSIIVGSIVYSVMPPLIIKKIRA